MDFLKENLTVFSYCDILKNRCKRKENVEKMEWMKDVEIIGAISGNSTANAKITGRTSHGFVYKITGESLYVLRGKQVYHRAGTLLFIPMGENYTFHKTTEEGTYRLVNFLARFDIAPSPFLFFLPEGDPIPSLLKSMESSWHREPNISNKYDTLSLFYKMLSCLTGLEQTKYAQKKTKERIEPAVNYLESHLFDMDLKVSDLPSLCGMSAPTFRQIFVARYGSSPRKYIIDHRLRQAKIILESGEYNSICEVARSVGYEDPLYFSKHFKATYGTAPSKL